MLLISNKTYTFHLLVTAKRPKDKQPYSTARGRDNFTFRLKKQYQQLRSSRYMRGIAGEISHNSVIRSLCRFLLKYSVTFCTHICTHNFTILRVALLALTLHKITWCLWYYLWYKIKNCRYEISQSYDLLAKIQKFRTFLSDKGRTDTRTHRYNDNIHKIFRVK
jgi:CRISPR/Cas system-associated protein endoribonuclease Cas2